jgi:hypothetical protein
MRWRGAVVAVLLMLGGAVSVGPWAAPAAACSCAALSRQQVVDRSEAVFVGTLVSHRVDNRPGRDVGTFDVHQVRKGTVAPRQQVVVSLGSSCGEREWAPGTYEIYAYAPPDSLAFPGEVEAGLLAAGPCYGPIRLTVDQVAALGISPPAPTGSSSEGDSSAVVLLSVVTVAALAGLVLIVRRERRKRELPADWTGLP